MEPTRDMYDHNRNLAIQGSKCLSSLLFLRKNSFFITDLPRAK